MSEIGPLIISILKAVFPFDKLGLNPLDLVIILVVGFYAYEGFTLGLIAAAVDLLSFIISFVLGLKLYSNFAGIFVNIFHLPLGIANAASFFVIALIIEITLSILLRKIIHHLPAFPEGDLKKSFIGMNHYLGIIPGVLSACIVVAFILTVVISLPSSPYLKKLVSDSRIGSRLVSNTAFFEKQMNDVFGGALHETLNFLTVDPESSESISLNFKVPNGQVDSDAEDTMLALVNKARVEAGLTPLRSDSALTQLARLYGEDMFRRGYFSHYNPEGKSPFDRMESAGITYTYAGENLALAPNVDLAMQGLMNSPGHRKNILSPNYNKVGIGVIDGGIYGEMFVQEFTD